MPRSVSPTLTAELQDTAVERRWLLYLGYSVPLRMYSGIGSVTWNSQTWSQAPFETRGPRIQPDGSAELELEFGNLDNTYTALFLGPEGVRNIACQLYHWDKDAELVFDGRLTACDIGRRCRVQAMSESMDRAHAPRLITSPPVHNHLIAPGTSIVWGGDKYIIEHTR